MTTMHSRFHVVCGEIRAAAGAVRSLLLLAVLVQPCAAQPGGQGGNQGGNQGGGFPGGITINPDGVISSPNARKVNPALEQRRLKALAGERLPNEMTTVSDLRKVSLVRFEQELQRAVDNGEQIDPKLRYLAGITQIHYLFALPETGDIVIAGPAEGFAPLQDGRVVGVETGRPVLVLDDLLAVLRLPNMDQTLGCSFDPDTDRLSNATAWNKANSSPASVGVARQRFFQMAQILGNWDVTVFGLPNSSHAAVTAVEADYQLKRLALGLEKPQIRGFRSHLDMARPGENTMRRWWFAPRYDVIERAPDGNAFHISGPRLQLLSQEELVDVQGNRSDGAFTEISAERYTKQFNKHMEALCRQVHSFAGIQNLFDLSIVVALIRKNDMMQHVNWTPTLLLDEERLPLTKYTVPTEVPSQVNVKSAGRSLLIGLIGGGVTIVPNNIIRRTNELPVDRIPMATIPDGRESWWWD